MYMDLLFKQFIFLSEFLGFNFSIYILFSSCCLWCVYEFMVKFMDELKNCGSMEIHFFCNHFRAVFDVVVVVIVV